MQFVIPLRRATVAWPCPSLPDELLCLNFIIIAAPQLSALPAPAITTPTNGGDHPFIITQSSRSRVQNGHDRSRRAA
jgi:hypothetical protein